DHHELSQPDRDARQCAGGTAVVFRRLEASKLVLGLRWLDGRRRCLVRHPQLVLRAEGLSAGMRPTLADELLRGSLDSGAGMGTQTYPKGLYVLFFAEMWERFSFYSMLAMFTLYLRSPEEGFGWSAENATTLYSNYLFFVY